MADIADLSFDIDFVVNFCGFIGKFYFPLFVKYSNIFNFLLFTDILNDLVDVIPGIKHHGVVRTQADCIRQPVGVGDDISHKLFFQIAGIHVSPGRNGQQQHQTDRNNQFGNKAVSYFGYIFQHC